MFSHKQITIDDIEIFIHTHNRSQLLCESISSFIYQSVHVKEITILDNDSSDDTELIVNNIKNKYKDSVNIIYYKTFGFLGNYKKTKKLCKKKFLMCFHDDDILNKYYLELVLKCINCNLSVSLITSRYTEFFTNEIPPEHQVLKERYYILNRKSFAASMFFLENVAYCSAVYRTEFFKCISLEYDKYGKYNDWPFMAKFGEKGKIILIDDEHSVYVRQHKKQDSVTDKNKLTIEQIINWDKFYYLILYQNKRIFSLSRIFYQNKFFYFMKGKFSSLKNTSLISLYKKANQMGVVRKKRYKYRDGLYITYLRFLKIYGLRDFEFRRIDFFKLRLVQMYLFIKIIFGFLT